MKYVLIFSPIILTILLVVILLMASFSKGHIKTSSTFSPTPTPIASQGTTHSQAQLSFISSTPADRSTDVSTNAPIIFVFNRPAIESEVTFTSIPEVTFSTKILGKTAVLTPSQPLNPGTTYYFFAQLNNSPQTFSFAFTTTSPQQQAQATVTGTYFGPGQDNTAQLMDQLAQKEHPDIYLFNRCPYTGADFSITSDFANTDAPHYFFVVTLAGLDKQAGKNDFLNWVLSLELTSSQIKSLDIRYQ